MFKKCLIFCAILMCSCQLSYAQQTSAVHVDSTKAVKKSTEDTVVYLNKDSVKLGHDSVLLKIDTLKHIDTVKIPEDGDSEIKDKIPYKAKDSIVYDISARKMYLYNGAEMHYQKIQLNADKVEFDWTTMIMTAKGAKDSMGNETGKPIFKDDGKEYRAGKMMYNFKNQRGKVFEVSTSEGDAYLHSEAVKRADSTSWFGLNSKYTTCNLDHPHFFFKAKKIKLVPNKVMITGPANLWIADIPTPLYIPFGIFPIKQGRRSGVIIPKYGSDAANGFFLRDGGYYWAVNDYLGAKFLAGFYTNGTFEIKPSLQYKVNYLYNGSLSLAYVRTRAADPDLPGAKSTNDFKVNWSFILDQKAAPTNSFSASVNISTANYNEASRVTDQSLYQTALSSNINYQKTFANIPFLSFTLAASHSQDLQTHQIDINFPTFGFNVTRVTPFKPKITSAKPKWYENIGVSYAFKATNSINTYDSLLLRPDFYKQLQYGADHAITIDAPFPLFKYFTVTPGFNYNERWYFQSVNESWIQQDQYITLPGGFTIRNPGGGSYLKSDTLFGFKAARDFQASVGVSTKITGIIHFKGKYLKAIRHVLTPQVSANYNPDFTKPFWGYYSNVRKGIYDPTVTQYGHFDIVNGLYGSPNPTKTASVTWALNNNFDMKVFSKKDTVTHEKKMGILERLNITGGYNFAADSLRFNPIAINGSMHIWDNISSTFGMGFDPYALGTNGLPINESQWKAKHQLLRFTNANVGLNASFHGKAKTYTAPALNTPDRMKQDYVTYNPDDYYDFNVPWNLSVAYTLGLTTSYQTYTQHDSLLFSQNLTINGDLNLTPKWKIAFNSGFDFAQKQLTLTHFKVVRNLHCWELSFDWTAWPLNYQQFSIELHVINPTLQDLKLTRKKTVYTY